ncbi:MAG: PepSY domain-containing protein [Anaerolineae bacterium]|nr:PepSY domain-containing protein [Anaerolineae bacterium]
MELIGVIQAMTSNTITVNQQVITTTGAEITTPLQIGVVVRVEGTLNADGSILARQITAVPAGVTPGEVEFIGTLESYSGTVMVVNGQTIDVSRAEIKPGVTVGQLVKVHATATGTGGWLAREVEPFSADASPHAPDELEITGTLEAISADSIVVSGQQISIVGAEIHGTLVVGVRVRVHAARVDGVLVAREVELALSDDNGNSNSNDNTDDNGNGNANGNGNSNDNSNDNGGAQPTITAQQAVEILLRVYPNAVITRIRLQNQSGRLVWELRTAQGVRMIIDATTGNILTIEQRGRDDNSNGNSNGNSNHNDNGGSDDNGNHNENENHNDNGDDSGGGSHNDNSGGGDDSGMGGMG